LHKIWTRNRSLPSSLCGTGPVCQTELSGAMLYSAGRLVHKLIPPDLEKCHEDGSFVLLALVPSRGPIWLLLDGNKADHQREMKFVQLQPQFIKKYP